MLYEKNIHLDSLGLSGKIEIPLPMRIGIFLIIYHNLCSVIVKITIVVFIAEISVLFKT
jgi:hypothetical protein